MSEWRDESYTIDYRLKEIHFEISFNTVPRITFALTRHNIFEPDCNQWKLHCNLFDFANFEANGVEEAKVVAIKMIKDALTQILVVLN